MGRGAASVPLQPGPFCWLSARLPVGRHVITALVRLWRSGDAERCRLCRDCTATSVLSFRWCLVLVDAQVEPEEVPLFSTRDLPRVDGVAGDAGGESGRGAAGLGTFLGGAQAVGEARDQLAEGSRGLPPEPDGVDAAGAEDHAHGILPLNLLDDEDPAAV